MKLYDMGAGLILGIFLMGTAAKINYENNKERRKSFSKIKVSDLTTQGHAPKTESATTIFIPADLSKESKAAIIGNLAIGSYNVVVTEPTTVDDTIVQDKASAKKQADKELSEVQKAIKTAVEKLIDMEEKDGKKNGAKSE